MGGAMVNANETDDLDGSKQLRGNSVLWLEQKLQTLKRDQTLINFVSDSLILGLLGVLAFA